MRNKSVSPATQRKTDRRRIPCGATIDHSPSRQPPFLYDLAANFFLRQNVAMLVAILKSLVADRAVPHRRMYSADSIFGSDSASPATRRTRYASTQDT